MQTLLPIILLGALGYLILIRPQRKARTQRQQLMSAISPGDEIISIGGVHGVVRDVDDTTVDVEISEGVIVRFERRAIAAITKDVPEELADDYRLDDEDEDEESEDDDEHEEHEAAEDEEAEPDAVADEAADPAAEADHRST